MRLSFKCADRFPFLDEPVENYSNSPSRQKDSLNLDLLVPRIAPVVTREPSECESPVSPSETSEASECQLNSDVPDFSHVSACLKQFHECMHAFIVETLCEFDFCFEHRDLFPMVHNGRFIEFSLFLAFEILSRFNSLGSPSPISVFLDQLNLENLEYNDT